MVFDGYNGVPVEVETAEEILNKTYSFRQKKLKEDINQDISYVIHTDISETGELGPERAYLKAPTETKIKMKMETGNYGEPQDVAKFASKMGDWEANVDATPQNILNHLSILQPIQKQLVKEGLEPEFRLYGEATGTTVEETIENYENNGLTNRIDLNQSLKPEHEQYHTGFIYDGTTKTIQPYALEKSNREKNVPSVARELQKLIEDNLE